MSPPQLPPPHRPPPAQRTSGDTAGLPLPLPPNTIKQARALSIQASIHAFPRPLSRQPPVSAVVIILNLFYHFTPSSTTKINPFYIVHTFRGYWQSHQFMPVFPKKYRQGTNSRRIHMICYITVRNRIATMGPGIFFSGQIGGLTWKTSYSH